MIQSPPVIQIIKISKGTEYLRFTLPLTAAADADAAEAVADVDALLLIIIGCSFACLSSR